MRQKALIAAAILFFCAGAFGQDPVLKNRPAGEPAGSDISFARLSFVEGPIFLQRALDIGYEEATVNTPIGEGDRLGTTEGRAEIAFGNFKFARLDQGTKIDIQTLPRGTSPLIRIRQMSGNLFLDLGRLDEEKSVELLTSPATFYFLEPGLYRVDIGDDGTTEILVFAGLVEAAAADGSVVVKEGQRLSLTDGRFDGRPAPFMAVAEDAFDRWNGQRAEAIDRPVESGHLPDEIAEYESELDEYGDWVYVEPFGSVWVPYGMASDWRPYSWGHWTWMPLAGWCWVPYESWGWSTSHYGRWHWSPVWGWYWIPLSGWGPGWVSWWWNDYYYGWAPLSWWGYPGIIYNNSYYGYGWNGDYPYDSKALTVVRKDQLQNPNVGRAALRPEEIRGLGRLNLRKAVPDVRPEIGRSLHLEPFDNNRGQFIIRKDVPPLTRDEAARALSRDSRTETPASPRLIRQPDRTVAGTKPPAGKAIENKGKTETKPPAERRIRKKEDDGFPSITPFPSSAAIRRQTSDRSASRSSSLLDKFYRYIQGDRKAGSSSNRSGTVSRRNSSSRSSSGSNRSSSSVSRGSTSSSRSSGSSSSRSGGASRSGSSRGGGGVRKK